MKIETIYVLERLNTGNYQHLELSATAKIEDGEDPITAMFNLKMLVNSALNSKMDELPTVKYQELSGAKEVVAAIKAEVEVEAPKKEKKPKAKKEVVAAPVVEEAVQEEAEEVSPVVEEKKEVPAVQYDRGLDVHKSMLSSYLTKTYEDWKCYHPKQKIIDFNSTLHGKDFLDEEGKMLQSFKDLLNGFYGH